MIPAGPMQASSIRRRRVIAQAPHRPVGLGVQDVVAPVRPTR
jgi:hypothetical protein